MNKKTAKLIKAFAEKMGLDPKDKNHLRVLKQAHMNASHLDRARSNEVMRKTIEATKTV